MCEGPSDALSPSTITYPDGHQCTLFKVEEGMYWRLVFQGFLQRCGGKNLIPPDDDTERDIFTALWEFMAGETHLTVRTMTQLQLVHAVEFQAGWEMRSKLIR